MGGNKISVLGVPRSRSKAINVKEEREREERLKVGNNNGQLRIANVTSGGSRKPPGLKY